MICHHILLTLKDSSMIDFIRIQYKNKSSIEPYIFESKIFDKINMNLEYYSGEISYPYTTSLENIDISITNNYVFIKNSLHKFYNSLNGVGDSNYTDFYYSEIRVAIELLCASILNLDKAFITKLEFGLNITTEISSDIIIRENVLMHKLSKENHNEKFFGTGELKRFDYSDYAIKVYDKAKQYNLPYSLMRYEIRFQRRRVINKLGIWTIGDLLVKENLDKLFSYLLMRFDEMIILDDYRSISQITPEDLSDLEKFTNPSFWEHYSKRKFRNQKSRYNKQFQALVNKYHLDNTKKELRRKINEKYNLLIQS